MSIDLNNAESQREPRSAIPPHSIVRCRATLRRPEQQKVGSLPELTRAKSGMEYLGFEFEVVAGSYAGAKFLENMSITGASNDRQEVAVRINYSKIRAMVEAARGIPHEDQSPQARKGRMLTSWSEIDGIEVPIMVGCKISDPDKNGRQWVNNTINLVITPDHEAYREIMAGGERITDEPLPEIPAAGGKTASPAPSWAQPKPQQQAPTTPNWGQGQQQQAAPQQAPQQSAPQQSRGSAMPSWGQQQTGPAAPPPPQQFPSEPSQMDRVPF
ncbi:MAG: hypothetical protein AB7D47_13045 [Desulfovibrio sp.]